MYICILVAAAVVVVVAVVVALVAAVVVVSTTATAAGCVTGHDAHQVHSRVEVSLEVTQWVPQWA